MMITSSSDDHQNVKLLDLPPEIHDLVFSFIPFKESFNFRVLNRQLLSAFLNYFRRWLRESLSIYNEHLIEKFKLIECYHDEYKENYQKEIERVEKDLNCKIPFILKELLMMTRHYEEESKVAKYSYYMYPVHWFDPIKTWRRENNLVEINDGSLSLIPNGKYNNIIIRKGEYHSKVKLWDSLCNPFSGIFKIEADSFQKRCKLECGRRLLEQVSGVTSIPLALCLLNHFTVVDISPQQIEKMVNVISPALYSNIEFLVKAVKIYYKLGKQIPPNLFNNREFCLRLVKSHGKMLKYCKQYLQDKNIVTQAVKQNGFAIKYLSSHFLRSNPYLIELAVSSKPTSLDYVSNSVPGFRKLVIKAIKGIEGAYSIPKFVNQEELLYDKEIVELLLLKNPALIDFMPNIWKECRPLAKKLCATNPRLINNFSKKIKEDPRILNMIAKSNPSILDQYDPNILSKFLKAWNLPPFTTQNYDSNMEQILERAKNHPDIYQFVMGNSNFDSYCTMEQRKRWLLIFLKEGISTDSFLVGSIRMRYIFPELNLEEQEDIIQWFLSSKPKPRTSSYTFSLFNKDLLVKHSLEAYKMGCRLSDSILFLATDPDDIAECLKYDDFALLCFSQEEYNSRKKMNPYLN